MDLVLVNRAARRPWMMAAAFAIAVSGCAWFSARREPNTAAAQPHLMALDEGDCRRVLRDDASVAALQQAAARSAEYLRSLPAERTVPAVDRSVSVAALLAAVNTVLDAAAHPDGLADICRQLRVYRVGLPEPVLFTGYYEPELPARRERSDRFRYPLYRTPDDLVDVDAGELCPACGSRVVQGRVENGRVVPYYSRAEIDSGVLSGRDLELAWLDDPVDVFFLHVQGSALLRLDDGVQMQVSYASANGRPYASIARTLVAQGKLPAEAAALQAVKDYLRAHPEEQGELLASNPRYIFFRTVIAGPIGSIGVTLTAGRSIAADLAVYPPGGIAFMRIAARGAPADSAAAFARVACIQDTGSAITGPGRIDVFWGTGDIAERIAGSMRDPGELYLLLPR